VQSWLSNVPTNEKDAVGATHNVLYLPLWMVGIAQSYRLMDWIDSRNYHVEYDVVAHVAKGEKRRIPSQELFPMYPHSLLLQSYIHKLTWGKIAADRQDGLRAHLLREFARRYCRRSGESAFVTAHASILRITGFEVDPSEGRRSFLARFRCDGGDLAHFSST
jgi:hypothetical protein